MLPADVTVQEMSRRIIQSNFRKVIVMKVIQYRENSICHECGKYGLTWVILTKGDEEGKTDPSIRLCGKCLTKLAKKIMER